MDVVTNWRNVELPELGGKLIDGIAVMLKVLGDSRELRRLTGSESILELPSRETPPPPHDRQLLSVF